MLERKVKILDELNFGISLKIYNDNYKTYGYKNENEMITELKQMKKDRVITFDMIKNKLYNYEIDLSTIKITELGKEILEEYK